MDPDGRGALDLSVLLPKGKYLSCIPYEEFSNFWNALGMSNPYRNSDKTLDSLIYEEIRSA